MLTRTLDRPPQSLVFTNCRHACSAERLQAWAVLLLDSFAQSSSLVEWRKGVEWGWMGLSLPVLPQLELVCFPV